MRTLPPEVLIYIQKMKTFFKKDKPSNTYFLKDVDEDLFFEHFTEISVKNFTELGSPELSIVQLELLNKTVRAICIVKTPKDNIWWEAGEYGKVCLN